MTWITRPQENVTSISFNTFLIYKPIRCLANCMNGMWMCYNTITLIKAVIKAKGDWLRCWTESQILWSLIVHTVWVKSCRWLMYFYSAGFFWHLAQTSLQNEETPAFPHRETGLSCPQLNTMRLSWDSRKYRHINNKCKSKALLLWGTY